MDYELKNKLHFRFRFVIMRIYLLLFYWSVDGKEIWTDVWAKNFDFNKIYVWGWYFPPFPFFEQLHHNSDN